jgi:hypothetical protein
MWSGFGVKNSLGLGSDGTARVFAALLLLLTTGKSFGATPILRSPDLTSFSEIHRLIIVFPGDSKREQAFLDQWDSTDVHTRMNHRSLLVFQVVNTKVIQELRQNMAPSESGFRVWLVGIGGHLLYSTDDEVEPWEIFNRIDALPGRKAEMQRYNNWVTGHRSSP